jgi:tetratricopeptide (TPR) repeat protein
VNNRYVRVCLLLISGLCIHLLHHNVPEARASGGGRAVLVVGNSSDQKIARSDYLIREKLKRLRAEGEIDSSRYRFMAYNYAVEEHRKYLGKLGINASELPMLSLTQLDSGGIPVKFLWRITARDPDKAIDSLLDEMGVKTPLDLSQSGSTMPVDENDPVTHIARGYTSYENGDFGGAVRNLTRALEQDPASSQAYRWRGHSYSKLKEFNRAISDYDNFIRLRPNDYRGYYSRGLNYYFKEDYQNSLKDFNRALEINPDDDWTFNARGNMYCDKGDFDLGIGSYNRAISINPSFEMAYYNRGLAYYEKKDPDMALRDFSMALELDPTYTKVYMARAKCYYNKRAYQSAWADVRKVREQGGKVDASFLEKLKNASGRND